MEKCEINDRMEKKISVWYEKFICLDYSDFCKCLRMIDCNKRDKYKYREGVK